MGFTPDAVKRMTPDEFSACVDGWNKAHGGKSGAKGMSEGAFQDAADLIDAAPEVIH